MRNTGLPSSSISSRSSLSTSYLVCFFLPTDPVGIILTFAIPFIPIVISSVALAIKRLHDRNKSGWWLLVFYLLPGVIDNIGMYTAVQLVFHLASLALSIWALVELGFLRGTSGSNKYGDACAEEGSPWRRERSGTSVNVRSQLKVEVSCSHDHGRGGAISCCGCRQCRVGTGLHE